jgi:hypothetical protein
VGSCPRVAERRGEEERGSMPGSDVHGSEEGDGGVLPWECEQCSGVNKVVDDVVPEHGCFACDLECADDVDPSDECSVGSDKPTHETCHEIR